MEEVGVPHGSTGLASSRYDSQVLQEMSRLTVLAIGIAFRYSVLLTNDTIKIFTPLEIEEYLINPILSTKYVDFVDNISP